MIHPPCSDGNSEFLRIAKSRRKKYFQLLVFNVFAFLIFKHFSVRSPALVQGKGTFRHLSRRGAERPLRGSHRLRDQPRDSPGRHRSCAEAIWTKPPTTERAGPAAAFQGREDRQWRDRRLRGVALAGVSQTVENRYDE